MIYREGRRRTAAILLQSLPEEQKPYLVTSPFLPDSVPENVILKPTTSLESLILEEPDLIVINSDFPLDETVRERLAKNLRTPVIYCSPAGRPMPTDRELADKYNLFNVVPQQIGRQQLEDAIIAKDAISSFVERGGKAAEELIQQMRTPSVRDAADIALQFLTQSENTKFQNRVGAYSVLLQWSQVVHDTLEYQKAQGEQKTELMQKLAPEAERLLQMVSWPTLRRHIKHLGEGIVGEDPVVKLLNLKDPELKKWIYRQVFPTSANTAAQIARQRSADAQWLMANKHPVKTSIILDPICFEDAASIKPDNNYKKTAFLMMRFIEGEPVYKALETLNEAYANPRLERHRKRINSLRTAFIRQYIDDCIAWSRSPPPIPAHFTVPNESEMHEQYRRSIANLMDNWRTCVDGMFTPDDDALYTESTKVLRRIAAYDRGIVRVIDSGLGNRIITGEKEDPEKPWNWKELVDRFAAGKKRHPVDAGKLKQSTRQIDIQRKYGHVLEDLAQIITFYESRFLLYDTGAERNKTPADNKSRFPREKIGKVLYGERDRYLDAIGWQDSPLKKDNLTYAMLLTFRAVRKLNLFFKYWKDSCAGFFAGEIDVPEFERRERTYPQNMRHYTFLGTALAYEATNLLKERRPQLEAQAPATRDLEHRYARAHQSSTSKELLDAILDPSTSPDEADLLRTYALRGILTRMDNCLRESSAKKRDPLVRYKP